MERNESVHCQESHLLLQEMESMLQVVIQVLQNRMALSPSQLMTISQIYPFFYCSSEASSNTFGKNLFSFPKALVE